MRVRLPLVAAAVTFAFAAGALASRVAVRDAHAQSAPFAATVYVPSDGIAFRAFDGRLVARLGYDAHGGTFELYDEHEQLAGRVRGDALTRVPPPSAVTPAPATPAPRRPSGDDFGF